MTHEYNQSAFTFSNANTYSRRLSLQALVKFVTPIPCVSCPQFFFPFLATDEFHFQSNGEVIQVEVINAETDQEITGVSSFTEKGFKLDFSKIPDTVNCVKIITNGACTLQHGYQRVREDCGMSTVLIESTYKKEDCLGYDYTTGYSNRIRIYAELEHISEEAETEEENDRVISEEIRSVYELRLLKELEPDSWMLKRLLKSVLRGNEPTTTYKGETIKFDKFTEGIEKNNEINENWLPVIKLRTPPCEKNLIC